MMTIRKFCQISGLSFTVYFVFRLLDELESVNGKLKKRIEALQGTVKTREDTIVKLRNKLKKKDEGTKEMQIYAEKLE